MCNIQCFRGRGGGGRGAGRTKDSHTLHRDQGFGVHSLDDAAQADVRQARFVQAAWELPSWACRRGGSLANSNSSPHSSPQTHNQGMGKRAYTGAGEGPGSTNTLQLQKLCTCVLLSCHVSSDASELRTAFEAPEHLARFLGYRPPNRISVWHESKSACAHVYGCYGRISKATLQPSYKPVISTTSLHAFRAELNCLGL